MTWSNPGNGKRTICIDCGTSLKDTAHLYRLYYFEVPQHNARVHPAKSVIAQMAESLAADSAVVRLAYFRGAFAVRGRASVVALALRATSDSARQPMPEDWRTRLTPQSDPAVGA